MDSNTAQIVLIGITTVAVIVWLISFQILTAASRAAQTETSLGGESPETGGVSSANMLTGFAEVEGQADELASRAASLLARGTLFPNVAVKIVEKSQSHLRFEQIESGGDPRTGSHWMRQGQLSFVSVGGGRTRIEWVVELARMQWLLRLGVLFQVCGLIAIIGGFWAIRTYLVPSPDPGARWQTVQMVQTVHFLWPPFLFAGLYRKGRRDVAARMQALANNLPYLGKDT